MTSPGRIFEDIGKNLIHFSAIGGIGMSAIAEVFWQMGYNIQGSNDVENSNTERLQNSGVKVIIGQTGENVKNAKVIVRSTAVKDNNPEIVAAKKLGIPVLHRSDGLAFLMEKKTSLAIGGSHGKTTNTAIAGVCMDAYGLDPIIINGGIINNYNDNARIGGGNYLVAEADESDGTFIKYGSKYKVITNIEKDHMDFYSDLDMIMDYFRKFALNTPPDGLCMIGVDNENSRKLALELADKTNVVTYGFWKGAQILISNLHQNKSGLRFDLEDRRSGKKYSELFLPMFGQHNALNAVPAIIMGIELGKDEATIGKALASFEGVQRRFTPVGKYRGAVIFDDYGHHPTEIKTTIATARDLLATGERIVAVFQPHRYSRTHALMDEFIQCFDNADELILADIYSAGELPTGGLEPDSLFRRIWERRRSKTHRISIEEELAPKLREVVRDGDIVVCMGAGSISKWSRRLQKFLEDLDNA